MANKTVPTGKSVIDFLEGIPQPQKKVEAYHLLEIMKSITGEEAVMWGPSIIGFGSYHYRYDSGREGDMLLTGFSPRAQNFSLYVGAGAEHNKDLLKKLGKFSTGKSCLNIKRLDDVNLEVLK
ncbi:MAG: DUF1801 domain-containing protein, partial [Flavobacteriaceae bacterium]